MSIQHTDNSVGELPQIRWNDYGGAPMAEHNMPCCQCCDRKAVLQLSSAPHRPMFQPCWKCQREGWVTVKATGWKRRLLRGLGLVD